MLSVDIQFLVLIDVLFKVNRYLARLFVMAARLFSVLELSAHSLTCKHFCT